MSFLHQISGETMLFISPR